jgi:ABC-2 type transport system permease protein
MLVCRSLCRRDLRGARLAIRETAAREATTAHGATQAGSRIESISRSSSRLERNLNLIRELSITQFKLKYTGSALGYLWSLVKPLLLFGIMYLVFQRLLRAGSNTPEFTVQLLLGVVLWTFFAESTSTAVGAIAANGGLIRKAYFPRWILVVASTMTASLTFVINTVLIVVVTAALGHTHLSLRSLAAVLFLVELIALIMGLSLLLSSLFVFFRDVGHIWEIVSLVLFYGSAVVYPFSLFPGGLRPVAGLNPLAQIIQDLRHTLVSPAIPWMSSFLGWLYVVPIALVLVVLLAGYLVFHRLTPQFAESL